MASVEEQVIETVRKFITEIKRKFPKTKPFINREYPQLKKKLESLIPEAIRNSQSVEMMSQVNIIYIYYIFYKQTWLRYYDSTFVQKNIRKFACVPSKLLIACLKIINSC